MNVKNLMLSTMIKIYKTKNEYFAVRISVPLYFKHRCKIKKEH